MHRFDPYTPRRWAFLVLAIIALAVAGCTGQPKANTVSANVVQALSAPDADEYARVTEPLAFSFPRDHGPHPDYRTEWWYYTGNLVDAAGIDYGYQLTFFRTALAPDMQPRPSTLAADQIYMAHFALTDGARQQHESFERYSRGAADLAGATGEPAFGVWLEDWVASEVAPGVYTLYAQASGEAGPVAIDLTLRETRPAVKHGRDGVHQKGPEPGNASYYYSLIGLDTAGVITSAGMPIAVTGVSWMDHEFGTSALGQDALGWDWFSMQFENGAAAMLYMIRTKPGTASPAIQGTLVDPDGSLHEVTLNDFAIVPTGEWTSPETGFTYPAGWRVTVPERSIDLTVTPLIPDQEMDVSFIYWEGAVKISGTWQDEPVIGKGYVELTGYGADAGDFQR